MNIQIKEIAKVWPDIQTVFSVPHNEKDYKKLLNAPPIIIIDGDDW
jgi:HTH-type transcriptional regulator/antitoxin HigA